MPVMWLVGLYILSTVLVCEMQSIWIVEDDEDIREIVLYALRSANFEAVGFETAAAFFDALKEDNKPDLLLLDIMLPGATDGLGILKNLRENAKYQALPIIMLTAKSSEHDKVRGLDLGADDYLAKPFGVMELLSRVRSLLRRAGLSASTENTETFKETFKDIEIINQNREVTVGGVAITLTFKEYELLRYLIMNKNIVLGRDKILEAVWGYDYEGESRTLDMHIKRLRQKLGVAGEYIKTVRNVGYKIGE